MSYRDLAKAVVEAESPQDCARAEYAYVVAAQGGRPDAAVAVDLMRGAVRSLFPAVPVHVVRGLLDAKDHWWIIVDGQIVDPIADDIGSDNRTVTFDPADEELDRVLRTAGADLQKSQTL
jgi:hypothetical protein